jgi:NAD(P)-dependent dehydrogenase (short-subunit alcohol dehydrogenase family)
MADEMVLRGRTALVTGAASGIGRALAQVLAARGARLALADLDEAGLAQTVSTLPAGAACTTHRLDVADRAAVAALTESIRAAHGRCDLLVNNAGVAIGGTFLEASEADFEWLFGINFWGTVRMTRAFLPMLLASDDARIVNLSSIYGIVAPPGQTAYSASKFAVRGFSNALRHELAEAGARVGVTVVHPGGVATNIARRARVPANADPREVEARLARVQSLLRMPPPRAAEIIVRGVERRRARVLVGADARAAALIEWLLPVSYWRVLRRRYVALQLGAQAPTAPRSP